MKSIAFSFLFVALLSFRFANGQTQPIDPTKFFEDSSILQATITTNMAKIFNEKNKTGIHFPARFAITLEDGTVIDAPISLETRGHFRKDYCYIPPLKVHFKSTTPSALNTLGSLKLVSQCSVSSFNRTFLLEEFLIYKMFNLITNLSFRVRLLDLNFVDEVGKKKPIHEYAFLLEDDKDLAKRNHSKEWKKPGIGDQATDRRQMTIVSIFEYMIGNTDWSVLALHNICLLYSQTDSGQHLYAVPYDFDFSGIINTNYATPDPRLNISTVHERVYRGFPRTEEELADILAVFKNQKNNIYSLINNCNLLKSGDKKEMFNYLDDFFELIDEPAQVKNTFIYNARTY